MKKYTAAIILTALVFGACGPAKTTQVKKPAIDYTQYEGQQQTGQDYSAEQGDDFTGTAASSQSSAYGDAVVVMASKTISLGQNATASKELRTFQTSLDKAYITAKRAYNPVGFTYSISPAGSVNPLSDMDVQCILSAQSSDETGQKTCDLFFKTLRSEFALATAVPAGN